MNQSVFTGRTEQCFQSRSSVRIGTKYFETWNRIWEKREVQALFDKMLNGKINLNSFQGLLNRDNWKQGGRNKTFCKCMKSERGLEEEKKTNWQNETCCTFRGLEKIISQLCVQLKIKWEVNNHIQNSKYEDSKLFLLNARPWMQLAEQQLICNILYESRVEVFKKW